MSFSTRTLVQAVVCFSLSLPIAAQGISAVAGSTPAVAAAPVGGPVSYSGPAAVKSQPYSLLATTTTVRTLADGTHITRTNIERRYRDSEGRTRSETSQDVGGESKMVFVNITDPVAHVYINLQPHVKTALVTQWPEVKAPTPQEEARRAEMHAKAEKARAAALDKGSCPVDPGFNMEHLGQKEIAGVLAEGTRTARIIPVGQQGNDREMREVQEDWRSPDLDIDLEHVDSSPENGVTTMKVSELVRGEPDAALFHAPADYAVTQRPSHAF